jgi:competence protein ComEC
VNYLHQIPLARLVIPLMVGITAAFYFPVNFGVGFYVLAILLVGAMAWLSAKGKRLSAWFGLLTSAFFALLGLHLVTINTVSNNANYFGNHLQNTNYIVATIDRPTEIKPKSVRAYLQVDAIKTPQGWVKATGTILTYFQSNDMSYALAYGDKLLLNIEVADVKPSLNPGQFNYKSFLARKGIYHQAYVKESDYTLIESNTGNPLYSWVYKVRSYMHWLLRESRLTGPELAVASALVLGYDDDIDSDLLQAYSASGTLHILSVSGMHAGLVFLLISWLLGFMGQTQSAKISRAVIIILSLWVYALLTGLSPPVIRAAVMFSLLAFGQSASRYINNYNILAGSCLLMLLFNPFLLADVGFQLSYSAVLGIALFYPCIHRAFGLNERLEISTHRKPIYYRLPIKGYNWLINGAWGITAVSLAAQLATLPLGLYYFHQFPVYFVAANLIIIPLSVLCIWGGMALLVVSWIPFVNTGLGWVLRHLIHTLNNLALYAEQLPFATWSNFKFSKVDVLAMFCIIAAALVALKSVRKQWLFGAMALSVVFMGFRVFQKSVTLHQQKLIVYNINKASAVEVINGSQSLLISDTSSTPGSTNYKFNIDAAQWYFGITNRTVNAPSPIAYYKPPVMVAGSKTILLYNQSFKPKQTTINGPVDYIVVSSTPYVDYKLIKSLRPKMVIFDGSNKPAKAKYWAKKMDELHIPYQNTAAQGAWVVDY